MSKDEKHAKIITKNDLFRRSTTGERNDGSLLISGGPSMGFLEFIEKQILLINIF